ncbi:hypothetical protein [Polyangium aurulentum]|uniref:hypothetical protein n=1 Tax=Polyangium aurulentum TaxID=2567896 RepID=UPI0010AE8AAB|nr:hypothetical protein [Polyangium aurulentum]UQA54785.1 hypothetical protein E8A73_025795 [Polyangium aurulentum]
MKRGKGARIAALALCLFVGACSTVLSLNDYTDAAAVLCKCPGFEKIKDCVARADALLAAASSEEQQAWLAGYDTKQCGMLCERADECYNDVPGCGTRRTGCECCAWEGSAITCSSGECQPCRTCAQLADLPAKLELDCISSRALLADVTHCACTECAQDCTGFCQGIDPLTQDSADPCWQCLEKTPACKPLGEACFADKT